MDGCACSNSTAPSQVTKPDKPAAADIKADTQTTSSHPKPSPVDLYKEEAITIAEEFRRYAKGILACHERGEKCTREAKIGRKMARRALREVRRGNNERLQGLWQLSTKRLKEEAVSKLRLEITY